MKKTIQILISILVIAAAAGIAWFLIVGNNNRKEPEPPVFSGTGDQRYETYKADDFEVQYPYWPNVGEENLKGMPNVKLAVANGNCNVIISMTALPEGENFKDFTEKRAAEQVEKTKSTVITKEIGDKTAYFVGEAKIGEITAKSVSYGFLTSKGNSWGIAFAAPKDIFDTACQPFIDRSVNSVAVK
ncbi:MAG: hypothetical protein MUD10_02885 [Candidatus Pacebacteria bacterium]|jgi:hypothetical protein|nr:hypothetical protein [Candidatus Paceibacterota bacterium]